MKKTFVKLGVLAVALALVFAACAQPTDEEGSSGPNAPTIVRLHLDKQETIDFAGVEFEIRIGEELYIAPTAIANNVVEASYPYVIVPGQNENKTSADLINDRDIADRTKVLAIPANAGPTGLGTPGVITAGETTLQTQGKKKFLKSGVLTAVAGADAVFGGNVTGAGIQTDNDDKTQRYIDIELVDVKPGSKGYGSVYSGSISGYLELAVVDNANATDPGVKDDTTYLYTKDKHGFNDFLRTATPDDALVRSNAGTATTIGEPIYGVRNANIKKVSLKSGINDIYLSFFSCAQFNE